MPNPITRHPRQQGAAALGLVLWLVFIATLASAHALRGQLADSRSAAHAHRAAQAMAAAEAGVGWATWMLGQGRVDARCQASDDPARPSFRDRHLVSADDGRLRATAEAAACVMAAGTWRCACQAAEVAALHDDDAPGFSLRLADPPAGARPGVARLVVRGCARAQAACLQGRERGEGVASLGVMLGTVSALPAMPAAAITTGGDFDPGPDGSRIESTDADGPGLAIAAGGAVIDRPEAHVAGRPGSPRATAIHPQLETLATQDLFTALFGLDRATHRAQPALVRVDCGDGDCSATLQRLAAAHPGRVLWVPGDLRLQGAVVLGTAQAPRVLSVDGNLHTEADFELHGLLHLRGGQWQARGASTRLAGALVAEHGLQLAGAPAIRHDMAVLRQLNLHQGSLVPVPGGWRDTPTAAD